MSEEKSVSDVDPDDLAEMMKGIDDLDDDLFGKKPKSKEAPAQKSVLKSSQQQELGQLGSVGRKVQFSAKTESDWDATAADDDITKEKEKDKVTNQNEPFKDPTAKEIPRKKVEIDFGDDDILGGLDSNTNKSKPKASPGLLDDIFGKTGEKGKKSSFLDDIISGGGGAGKEPAKEPFSKSEFTLDAKYKVGNREKSGFDLGHSEQSEQPRRRRGNPTVGGKKASESELLSSAPKKGNESEILSSAPSTKPETGNPFPWMTEKPAAVPNPDVKNSNQNETSRLTESIKPSFVEGPNQKEPTTRSTTIQFTPTLPHPQPQFQPNQLPTPQAGLEEYSKVGLEHQKVFEAELESYKVATAQRNIEI